jgi:hypothetical protein
MKSVKTTATQILEVWETAHFRLSAQQKKEFKNNKVTKKLCEKRLVDIKVAIYLGKKQYLPDILDYLKPAKDIKKTQSKKEEQTLYKGASSHKNRPQGRLRAVVPVEPHLWAGNYSINLKETSTYNCSVCESPVIGLRCKCALAA